MEFSTAISPTAISKVDTILIGILLGFPIYIGAMMLLLLTVLFATLELVTFLGNG